MVQVRENNLKSKAETENTGSGHLASSAEDTIDDFPQEVRRGSCSFSGTLNKKEDLLEPGTVYFKFVCLAT